MQTMPTSLSPRFAAAKITGGITEQYDLNSAWTQKMLSDARRVASENPDTFDKIPDNVTIHFGPARPKGIAQRVRLSWATFLSGMSGAMVEIDEIDGKKGTPKQTWVSATLPEDVDPQNGFYSDAFILHVFERAAELSA